MAWQTRHRFAVQGFLTHPPRLIAVVVVALMVIGAPAGALALRTFQSQPAQDGPSPATGHAQVIAQGVATLPSTEMAWRVVADTAEIEKDTPAQERALGFALADDTAILINDVGRGTQSRLAAGEAAFVPEAAQEQRLSLARTDATYYRIGLVPVADAQDAGGDELILGGTGFAAPTGRRDLDLVRDVLKPNEESTLPDTGAPTLVLVTSGEIEIEPDLGEIETLGAGEAAVFEGSLILGAVGETGATFAAALIGPEVPAPPTPPTGSITLRLFTCPEDVSAADITAATDSASVLADCDPLAADAAAELDLALIAADDTRIGSNAATVANGVFTWSGLAYGDYVVAEPDTLPEGTGTSVLIDSTGQVVTDSTLTIAPETPNARVDRYFLVAETGTIALQVRNCPPGMTFDNLVGDDCDLAPEDSGYAVELRGTDGTTVLTLADAVLTDGIYTWSDIPVAAGEDVDEADALGYEVVETILPTGFEDYVVYGTGADAGEAPIVRLTTDRPTADVTVYNVRPATGDGTLVVQVFTCLDGVTATAFDASACTLALDGYDLAVYPPGGGTLTLADAVIGTGEGSATFSNLPLGDIDIEVSPLPAGYVDFYSPDYARTPLVNRTMFRVPLLADAPNAAIELYAFLPAPDGDNDGATDDFETANGSDPNDPDTDGDGLIDGDEFFTIFSDPTDADTDDDGVDDGDEVAAGTDPLTAPT